MGDEKFRPSCECTGCVMNYNGGCQAKSFDECTDAIKRSGSEDDRVRRYANRIVHGDKKADEKQ